MKRSIALLAAAVFSLQFAAQPAYSFGDKDRAALAGAAVAILGIAALAHGRHHYQDGYEPQDAEETAEFERGYRDAVHGYPYWEQNRTRGYAQGYQAGDRERANSMAHRQVPVDMRAPPMANQGCAENVARNFSVAPYYVHITKSRPSAKHEWLIEAAVGHQYMICTMRDTGELLDLRGGMRL